jgi:chromosome segregation protein
MDDHDVSWLGDPRWQGYPRLQAVRDLEAHPPEPAPPRAPSAAPPDPRTAELARENETLRARQEELARLAAEFDRRLSEAGAEYEGAVLQAESRLRDAALERERLAGELESARAEIARLSARDAAREADLRLERERRADADKALLETRRRLHEAEAEADRLRAAAAESAGAVKELRAQADAHSERLVRAKELTDQDVRLLRQEMREFLAKFHRLKESLGDQP